MSTDLRALLRPLVAGAAHDVSDALAEEVALAAQRTEALSQASSVIGGIPPEQLVTEDGIIGVLNGNTGYRALDTMLHSPHFDPQGPFRVGLATTPEPKLNLSDSNFLRDVTRLTFGVHAGVLDIRLGTRLCTQPEAERNPALFRVVESYARRLADYHDGTMPSPHHLLDFQGEKPDSRIPINNKIDWSVLQSIAGEARGSISFESLFSKYEVGDVHAALADPVLRLLAGALVIAHGESYEITIGGPETKEWFRFPSRQLILNYSARPERAERLQREYYHNAITFLLTLIISKPTPERQSALEKVYGMLDDETNKAALDEALVELCIVAPHRVSLETEKEISVIMDYLLISRTVFGQTMHGTWKQFSNLERVSQALEFITKKTGKEDLILERRKALWHLS